MKPLSSRDPRDEQLDELIVGALHGVLTPEERAQLDTRLTTDPAAQAAYQEAQAMHDLLEKTHKDAQPDPAFEQRMVSGVRRKLQTEQHRETALESLLALWSGTKSFFARKRTPFAPVWQFVILLFIIIPILAGVALGPITNGIKQSKQSAEMQEAHSKALADYQAQVDSGNPNPVMKDIRQFMPQDETSDQVNGVFSTISSQLAVASGGMQSQDSLDALKKNQDADGFASSDAKRVDMHAAGQLQQADQQQAVAEASAAKVQKAPWVPYNFNGDLSRDKSLASSDASSSVGGRANYAGMPETEAKADAAPRAQPVDSNSVAVAAADAPSATPTSPPVPTDITATPSPDQTAPTPATTPTSTTTPPAIDTRKLIRNAQLDLEVKSFQAAMDQITAMTKAAGGYVDTSNSQKGGNGKLQGTVVVKVLPQNLDGFLFSLRNLGEVQNQSVSTDDVTKDYFDTQARLDNSRRMETQLQDLLKHENSKVADLLEVERELGRVRGDIEQMQGQLKLYDFQVQYATVTMNLSEKDLNQAAAYLLKEQDDFSLFATDVEATFQKARQSADDFKAQVLTANLNHNSGSDVSAELVVMVAPDQIESFLAQVRGLGRVANFTRQTQRVAQDGGDSSQPADETKTEKDKVQVHLAIRSDDETRKQVALTVVAKAVDVALDLAKTAALADTGVEILSSSLNKTPQGQSTAQIALRVPGKDYTTLIAALEGLGRTASISIQRNDDAGPGANGDDAPVIVSLSLTDDDQPLQETQLSIVASDVDGQSQQIKKSAADAGVEVEASSFERQPDGTEIAQMTFRLPMAKYPAFVETLKQIGKVESLTVHRDDRPDQTVADDTAPAEISLQLHNEREIVADNSGLWSTLRDTFSAGAMALFGSIRVIGVLLAFLTPWVFTLVLLAWVGRRIYIWRKK